MSEEPLEAPTSIDLPPEAFAKFWDAINNPKPPTQALIDLMKSPSPWDGAPELPNGDRGSAA